MKIIDLLNKIANGEEVPKKIKIYDKVYELDTDIANNYLRISGNAGRYISIFEDWNYDILNDEVEIIEEDKKIEKIPLLTFSDLIDMDLDKRIDVIKENRNKINELIDKVNSLENK